MVDVRNVVKLIPVVGLCAVLFVIIYTIISVLTPVHP